MFTVATQSRRTNKVQIYTQQYKTKIPLFPLLKRAPEHDYGVYPARAVMADNPATVSHEDEVPLGGEINPQSEE